MEDDNLPAPHALREVFRYQRWGAPFSGGYRQWPLKWLIPVEAAMVTMDTLQEWNRAVERYKKNAEGMQKWKADNPRLVKHKLWIEQLITKAEQEDSSG